MKWLDGAAGAVWESRKTNNIIDVDLNGRLRSCPVHLNLARLSSMALVRESVKSD